MMPSLLSAMSERDLPEAFVRAAMETLSAEDASLMVLGADGTLHLAYSTRIKREEWDQIRVPLGSSMAGRAAQSRSPLLLNGDGRSSIVFPVLSGDVLLAVLNFNRSARMPSFGAADLSKAAGFATSVAVAMENAARMRALINNDRQSLLQNIGAGMAHDINTALQFGSDSLESIFATCDALLRLSREQRALLGDDAAIARLEEELDLEFLVAELPGALERGRQAFHRIADAVRAIKTMADGDTCAESIDVNEAMRAAIAGLRAPSSIELRTSYRTAIPIRGNARELELAFLAILHNAVESIGARPGTIRVETGEQEDQIVVRIADDGAGIPPAVKERVFEPFFTTKDVGKSRGLGLSLARSIVERHGGALSFDSIEGQGTTFYARLSPRRKEQR